LGGGAQITIKNKLKLYYSIRFQNSFEEEQKARLKDCLAIGEQKKSHQLCFTAIERGIYHRCQDHFNLSFFFFTLNKFLLSAHMKDAYKSKVKLIYLQIRLENRSIDVCLYKLTCVKEMKDGLIWISIM